MSGCPETEVHLRSALTRRGDVCHASCTINHKTTSAETGPRDGKSRCDIGSPRVSTKIWDHTTREESRVTSSVIEGAETTAVFKKETTKVV
jgi:hypothetical protein